MSMTSLNYIDCVLKLSDFKTRISFVMIYSIQLCKYCSFLIQGFDSFKMLLLG